MFDSDKTMFKLYEVFVVFYYFYDVAQFISVKWT